MKKDIMNLLHLKGVIVDKIKVEEKLMLVYVRSPRNYARCPSCNTPSKKKHQEKERRVAHGIIGRRQIRLVIRRRRFQCRSCRKPFSENNIPGVTRKRHSQMFQEQTISDLARASFKDVARRYQVSSPTLVKFLASQKPEIGWPEENIVLNVDEHSYSGHDLKITVGDARSKRLIAVLNDDRQATLRKFAQNIPEQVKSRISEACIDMKHGYRTVLEEELPQTKIVVDHFHVIRELQRQLDDMRRIIQEVGPKGYRRIPRLLLMKNAERLSLAEQRRLRLIFEQYRMFPALRHCYWIKERVRELYRSRDYQTAEKKLNTLINMLEDERVGKLKEIREMLKRWKPYILNYFHNRTTNAFIEGVHNKIKLTKRISFGFRNFQNYVLKVTLALLPFAFLPGIYHTKV